MSYQLIYTTHGKVADAVDSSPRVVARTQTMPAEIVQALIDKSALLCPVERGEALFLYSAAEYGGEKFHVLGSVRESGQRDTLIAHYLLLRDSERRNIMQSDPRATPAGILLLLELQRFWVASWDREPVQWAENEARLTGECPAAELGATWQVFTGDKERARMLQEPPYNKRCLVSVPPGTKARDALRLLHESDVLSVGRGWESGLCVNVEEPRLLRLFQRVVSTAQGALLEQAQQQQIPVLQVRPHLSPKPAEPQIHKETAPSSPAPAVESKSAELPDKEVQTPAAPSDSPLSKIPLTLPCHYAECASDALFERNLEEKKKGGGWKVATILGVSVGVLLVAALLPRLLQKEEGEPQPGEQALPDPQPLPGIPSESKAPEGEMPEKRTALHGQINESRQKQTGTEESVPLPVDQAPVHAVSDPVEAAEQTTTGDDTEDLTSDERVDELDDTWVFEDDTEDLTSDERGKEELVTPAGDGEDLTTMAEDREVAGGGVEVAEGPRKVIVAGRALPKELLPEEVSMVDRGECILHFKTAEDQKERRVIPLQPGDTVLQVRRESAHSVSVAVLRGGKPIDDLPVFTITEKNNRLKRITADGKAAAVQLPYFNEQGGVSHAILLPKLSVQVEPDDSPVAEPSWPWWPTRNRVRPAGYRTPPVKEDDLDWDNLSQRYDPKNKKCVVNLSKIEFTQRSELTPAGSLLLPDFGLQNEVRITSDDASYSVSVQSAKSAAAGMTAFSWTITRKFDFRKHIENCLSEFAFEPPEFGRKKSRYCFNDLYGLVSQLAEEENPNRRESMLDRYSKMFRDEDFAQYARKNWMDNCPQLAPAGGEVRRMWLSRENKNIEKIRQSLLRRVDEQVREAYSAQCKMPTFTLSLSKVKLSSQNKLTWIFTLRIGN